MSTGDKICQIPRGELGPLEYGSVIGGSEGRLKDGVRGIEGLAREMALQHVQCSTSASTEQVSKAGFPSCLARHCSFSLSVSVLMPLHVPGGPSGTDAADPRWQTQVGREPGTWPFGSFAQVPKMTKGSCSEQHSQVLEAATG